MKPEEVMPLYFWCLVRPDLMPPFWALMIGVLEDLLALVFDRRLGAIGAAPDLAQTRQWYQRAAELGSSAASQQLAGLGDDR